jgi:serine/threonine protein kinase
LVKIADFGLATIHKFVEQTHKSDVEHIEYLAPEVFNGGIYDTRADIYSLGIILNGLFDIKSENK